MEVGVITGVITGAFTGEATRGAAAGAAATGVAGGCGCTSLTTGTKHNKCEGTLNMHVTHTSENGGFTSLES